MILPLQALHQHRRYCLPGVSHDFALPGTDFARIGADFARAYPRLRPLCSRVGGAGFSSCSRAAAPLRRVDLAVGNASANREGWIDQCIKIDALEIFANEYKTSVRDEVVGRLFDDKVGHNFVHLQGEQNFTPK